MYARGSHLLCHDDVIGTRCVSYILYLSRPGQQWVPRLGGALELYATDEAGGAGCSIARSGAPRHSRRAACLSLVPTPPRGDALPLQSARHTQGERLGRWAPSHRLGCSSEPPPEPPSPLRLTMQAPRQLRAPSCRATGAHCSCSPCSRASPSMRWLRCSAVASRDSPSRDGQLVR